MISRESVVKRCFPNWYKSPLCSVVYYLFQVPLSSRHRNGIKVLHTLIVCQATPNPKRTIFPYTRASAKVILITMDTSASIFWWWMQPVQSHYIHKVWESKKFNWIMQTRVATTIPLTCCGGRLRATWNFSSSLRKKLNYSKGIGIVSK